MKKIMDCHIALDEEERDKNDRP